MQRLCFGNILNLIFFAKVHRYADKNIFNDIAVSFGVGGELNCDSIGMIKNLLTNVPPALSAVLGHETIENIGSSSV